jgi:hypothetical protein
MRNEDVYAMLNVEYSMLKGMAEGVRQKPLLVCEALMQPA